MKNVQRGLALILSVLLLFSTIPLSVFALESNATDSQVEMARKTIHIKFLPQNS